MPVEQFALQISNCKASGCLPSDRAAEITTAEIERPTKELLAVCGCRHQMVS